MSMRSPVRTATLPGTPRAPALAGAWAPRPSLALVCGFVAYLFALRDGHVNGRLLLDGDTYWHIATGRWILAHQAVPALDPFSHSLPQAPWVAHEWLSEVLLALAHQAAGWDGVVALTAAAFALSIALFTRYLAVTLPPARTVLMAAFAILMTMPHLLARPHMLAMPLMVTWVAILVRCVDRRRSPPWALLAAMAAWANLHGGFTLGLGMALALGVEAVWLARHDLRMARRTAIAWGGFMAGAVLASTLTPQGWNGLLFTWHMTTQLSFSLSRIGEWRSPDFQELQPLAVWLLVALAAALHRGLRLPPMRLVLTLGLLYMALRHMRHVELVGLLVPLLVARALASQWADPPGDEPVGRWLASHRTGSNLGARLALVAGLAAVTWATQSWRAATPPVQAAPAAAVDAALAAGARGNVLNSYPWGGYLILRGIPVHIDGRADMYGDAFVREYIEALELRTPRALPDLLAKYRIGWTLLPAGSPTVAMLDLLPGWRRVHTDDQVVVHLRTPDPAAQAQP